MSINNTAAGLRAFFRYAGKKGWCNPLIAEAIKGPRIFAQENLPSGPSWHDVRRLLVSMKTNRPRDIRNRPIIMLFAIYGLRAMEVTKLRLEDIDWEHDLISVPRVKGRGRQLYPLSPALGNAILRYLQEVRPQCSWREVFLTFSAPLRPIPRSGLYSLTKRLMLEFGISTLHMGPHALRHACAAHLVEEGFSLKEIGDHLGHRSSSFLIIRNYVDSTPLPNTMPKGPEPMKPYIYTLEELRRLLAATDRLQTPLSPLRAHTFHTLILTLYGTGLRIGEALSLTLADVNLRESLIMVRSGKFFKTRLAPIGPRLTDALQTYVQRRRKLPCPRGEDSAFFVTRSGNALTYDQARRVFPILRNLAGIHREREARYQPRVHDIRHTMAVHRLVAWYREGADVQRLLPLLSTYLGHLDIAGTQRYLSFIPELRNEASRRFEHYALREVEDEN